MRKIYLALLLAAPALAKKPFCQWVLDGDRRDETFVLDIRTSADSLHRAKWVQKRVRQNWWRVKAQYRSRFTENSPAAQALLKPLERRLEDLNVALSEHPYDVARLYPRDFARLQQWGEGRTYVGGQMVYFYSPRTRRVEKLQEPHGFDRILSYLDGESEGAQWRAAQDQNSELWQALKSDSRAFLMFESSRRIELSNAPLQPSERESVVTVFAQWDPSKQSFVLDMVSWSQAL